MINPYRYFLYLLVLCSIQANGQILRIRDEASGKSLEGVIITCSESVQVAQTNSRGEADISSLKGCSRLNVRHISYAALDLDFAQLSTLNFEVSLQPINIRLNDVVFVAGRVAREKSKEIWPVARLNPSDQVFYQPQTMADFLGASAQVFIQKSQQAGGSPMIRGFATNRLLYTIDGVRMNTAIFRAGNIQNVISLDAYSMQETEILFGSGSVMYGSDAIGGVMQFKTLSPAYSLNGKMLVSGSAASRFSSANMEQTAHADINLGWKKFALLSSITLSNFGDLRMGSHGPDDYLRKVYQQRQDTFDAVVVNDDPRLQRPTGYNQINLMQKAALNLEKLEVVYGFHYSNTGDYPRYDRLARYNSAGIPRSGDWYYGPQFWMMHQLGINIKQANLAWDKLQLNAAYQRFEESRFDRDFNKNTLRKRLEEVDAYALNADAIKLLAAGWKLTYGLEAVINRVSSSGTDSDIRAGTSQKGPSRYPNADWYSQAVYGSVNKSIRRNLHVEAGLRYSNFRMDCRYDTTFYPFPYTGSSQQNGAFNGNLGLAWNLPANWKFSLIGSSGFRAPNVDDAGKVFDPAPGTVTVPNPDIKPEYAWNADVGIGKRMGNTARFEVHVYATRLNDALVRRDFLFNGSDSLMYDGNKMKVVAIQNQGYVTVLGLSVEGEWNFYKAFTISGNWNFQEGKEINDDGSYTPSRHAAPWFGTARLSYKKNKFRTELYLFAQGSKTHNQLAPEEQGKKEIYALDANGNTWNPGWYTLNFRASYSFWKDLTLNLGVENLTDQRYRAYSTGIAGAGRNLVLSARIRW